MERFKNAIDLCCDASAAKLNWDKCVGVALGNADTSTFRAMPGLGWMQPDEAERYLGAYIGNSDIVGAKWNAMIAKIEERATKWSAHHVSLLARIIVSKSSLASCMWYMSQCMFTPPTIVKRIQKIVNSFVWGKQPRFMDAQNSYKHRKLNGMSMLSIEAQSTAFHVKATVRLLAPDHAKWKCLPLHWLTLIGQQWDLGSNTATAAPCKALLAKFRKSKLPPFWKQAFKAWNKNRPSCNYQDLTAAEILNQHLWLNSALVPPSGLTTKHLDFPTLHNNKNDQVNYFRIIDLWDDQEQDWTSAEFAKSRKWIKTAPQMRDYKEIIHIINSQRPEWLTTLRGDDPPPCNRQLVVRGGTGGQRCRRPRSHQPHQSERSHTDTHERHRTRCERRQEGENAVWRTTRNTH